MQVIAETHSHTVACDHAYSTIIENAREASRKGIRFLCITEHGPKMIDGPYEWFFKNMGKTLPNQVEGVILLKGAEVNIMNYDGALDLSDECLHSLDWIIASYHTVCCPPASSEEHTRGWLAVAENPLVHVIGHCGDGRYPFDKERVIQAFAAHRKIVEINSHSFEGRPGSTENCQEVALLCKKYGVRVVCSSDAHFCDRIGAVEESFALLQAIDFPKELILNIDYKRFLRVARECSGRQLTDQEEL